MNALRIFAVLAAALWVVPAGAQGLADRLSELHKAAAKEGKVTYYNEGREEENAKFAAFWKQTFPDIRLLVTAKQTLALIPGIEAERAAGHNRADVVTITEPFITAAWKAKGYYSPYKVASFARLAPDYADADGSTYVVGLYLLTAAYNTKALPDRAALPKALADFADPRWKGKIVLADPKNASSDLVYFYGMMQLGKLDWPGLQRLVPQDVLFVRGNAEAADLLAAGERVITPIVSSQNLLAARAKGQPVDFFATAEGSIEIRRTSGIFKDAPDPNAARLLLEVLTSPEGQSVLSEAGAFWPTNPDAKVSANLPKLSGLNPINVLLDTDDATTAAFIKRFDAAFGRE